jgi:hypothetical protein
MADITNKATKQINSFSIKLDKLVNPLVLKNWQKKITKGVEIVLAISEAIKPYYINFLETIVAIDKTFKDMRYNQFLYQKSILHLWDELEEELKHKTRFFPKSEFITIFKKCVKEARYNLKTGTILYRARKIEIKEFPNEVQNLLNTAIEQYEDYDYQKLAEKAKNIFEYIQNISFDEWERNYMNENQFQNSLFWGFNKAGSDAPRDKTTQGRVNPLGINYLYTAKNIDTAISEIQPTIGQIVSVASIKTRKKLNLFDFNFYGAYRNSNLMQLSFDEIKEKLDLSSFWELEIFFNTISELFSKPAFGNSDNYYTTQFLSELLKDMGFDGIRYKSSLKRKGINIVLFDISKDGDDNPKNYEILSSSLHRIENVKVTSKILLPKEKSIKQKKN